MKYLLLLLYGLLLSFPVFAQEELTHALEGSVDYAFEDEDFETLLSAWQDIKVHNFDLLVLGQGSSDVYPGGEVLQLDKKRYSTAYIFVIYLQGAEDNVINIRTDMLIFDNKMKIRYEFYTQGKISEELLAQLENSYRANLQDLDGRFVTYLLGRDRLAKTYHQQ